MATAGTTRRVILDTDLGTDVDDAYALAILASAADVELRAVTTVYADTLLRARLASRLLDLMGLTARVIVGAARPLSGDEPWVTGEEGAGYDGLEADVVDESIDAADYIVEETRRFPGEIDIVAIGPLTNIATAIARDPGVATRVRHLWIMGGRFDSLSGIEHNFRSDAVAASVVFASGIPITVTGVEVTQSVHLVDSDVANIGRSGPFGAALERDTRRWMERWSEDFEVPHDAVVALTLLRPELFETLWTHVAVEATGPEAGRCRVLLDETPNAEVVLRVHVPAVAREIVDRVCAASGRPGS